MSRKNKITFLISCLLAGGFSIFASVFPDGLERVAEDQNFINNSYNLIAGFIPDYVMPGVANKYLAVALAGTVGTTLTFFIVLLFGKILIKYVSNNSRSN